MLELDGQRLSLAQIAAVARSQEPVKLSANARQRVERSRGVVEKIIAEGKEIFEGVKNIDVNCSSCHGKDGKPVKAGARDFRKSDRMKLYSDSVWLWRISEGVPNTKMKAWKSKLSEEDRWKAMAYEHNFGLKGLGWDVATKQWVQADQIGKVPAAAPATAPGEAKPAGAPASKPSEAPKKDGK